MDGTLLNSSSRISAATAAAVKRCLQLDGLTVVLCTGKARPAAINACEDVGLAGMRCCASLQAHRTSADSHTSTAILVVGFSLIVKSSRHDALQ